MKYIILLSRQTSVRVRARFSFGFFYTLGPFLLMHTTGFVIFINKQGRKVAGSGSSVVVNLGCGGFGSVIYYNPLLYVFV